MRLACGAASAIGEGGLVRLHTLDGSAEGARAKCGSFSSALTAKHRGGQWERVVPSHNLTDVQSDVRVMTAMEPKHQPNGIALRIARKIVHIAVL
jgi:hypothetical protein